MISKKRLRKKAIRKKDNAIKKNDASLENSLQQIKLDYDDCLNRRKMI